MRSPCPLACFLGLLGAVLFTGCAPKQPTPPVRLTVATGEIGVATTAVGPNGTVYWTWFGKEDGATNVYLARLEPGDRAPSQPVRVNTLPGNANQHAQAPAQVAVGPEGNVYVVWTNRIDIEGRRFPASDLFFARSTDGGRSFEKAVIVNDDAGGVPTGHTFHDLTVGSDGMIYVSWIDSREQDRARTASTKQGEDHAGHSQAENGHMHGHPGETETSPGPEIRLARSTDRGQTFSQSVVVDRGSCPCCRTALAVADDGTIYLAWRKVFDGDVRDMVVARSTDRGQTFSEPARIHNDGWTINGCPHSGPALAVDRAGRLHAAWYTGAEHGPGLFYAVSDDGGRHFGLPQTLLSDVPVTQVRMAPDPTEGVWLAWEDKPAKTVRLAHAVGEKVVPTDDALDGDLPALAVAGAVQALVWNSQAGLEARIVAGK